MKKLIPLFALSLLVFTQCKKDNPQPNNNPAPQDDFIAYWNNYDHFVYQHVIDTAFRDTNQFVMFDLEVKSSETLKRHSHAGGASISYNYKRTENELTLEVNGTNITYKIAKLTADSMILESKVGPTGGIPVPQEDKDIWHFAKKR